MNLLAQAHDVTAHVLRLVVDCTEDWFPPGTTLDTEDFIDRLCSDYLVSEGMDIERLDTPAVRRIMRHARGAQRDLA